MSELDVGYADRCFQDVRPCGDGMVSHSNAKVLRLMLADGIGHGQTAHNAVKLLKQKFSWFCERSQTMGGLAQCIQEMHDWMKDRGPSNQAAVAVIELNGTSGVLSALSVGNVKAHLIGHHSILTIPTLNGMVGGRLPASLPLTVEQLKPWSLLVVHSDGISARALHPYLKSLPMSHTHIAGEAQLLAQRIVDRFSKSSDDASCAVVVLDAGDPA